MAPATALAVNMHCYWTGVAADLARLGDDACRWILEKAGEGEIFAALHGEAGNDMPLLLAVATAARVEGGWEISGHKIFGSLSPVWTYGGFHAIDTSDPANPKVVHGFLPRGSAGCQIVETWDTIGMRATQRHDTVLDKAFCPDELVPWCARPASPARTVPRVDLRLGRGHWAGASSPGYSNTSSSGPRCAEKARRSSTRRGDRTAPTSDPRRGAHPPAPSLPTAFRRVARRTDGRRVRLRARASET